MDIVVRLLSGRSIKLPRGLWTVGAIKGKLGSMCSVKASNLQLFLGDSELFADREHLLPDTSGCAIELDCLQKQAANDNEFKSAREVVLLSRPQWLACAETDFKDLRTGSYRQFFARCAPGIGNSDLSHLYQTRLSLQDAPRTIRDDREVVQRAIGSAISSGRSAISEIEYASSRLRADPDFVKWAVVHCPYDVDYTLATLRPDLDFARAVVYERPEAVDYVESAFHLDPVVMQAIVKIWLPIIEGGSITKRREVIHPYREDDIVWNPPSSVQMNKELVLAWVEHSNHWSTRLTIDRGHDDLTSFWAQFANDHDVVLAVVKKDGMLLDYAGWHLCCDPEIVTAAVSQNGLALQFADNRLRSDHNVVKAAVSNDGFALEFASSTLRANESLRQLRLKESLRVLQNTVCQVAQDSSLCFSESNDPRLHRPSMLRWTPKHREERFWKRVPGNRLKTSQALREAWSSACIDVAHIKEVFPDISPDAEEIPRGAKLRRCARQFKAKCRQAGKNRRASS